MVCSLSEVRRLLQKYNYDDAVHAAYYGYGTAGFRFLATELPPIMVRVGIAVALWTTTTGSSPVLGVMVTASHNTEEYNGVKLAGLDGGMIDPIGEQFVVDLVNERDIEKIVQRVQEVSSLLLSTRSSTVGGNEEGKKKRIIYMGMDTREHSVSLSCLVQSAVRAVDGCCDDSSADTGGIEIVQLGPVTTPQLHFLVRQAAALHGYLTVPTLPVMGLEGYYQSMVQAYQVLVATAAATTTTTTKKKSSMHNGRIIRKLYVDCANGVGYPHVKKLQQLAPLSFLVARNGPGDGPLNERCGSEYVQKMQCSPCWFNGDAPPVLLNDGDYCASLDGDADRIVVFKDSLLLDGDKIACLIGNFIRKQLDLLVSGEDNEMMTTTTTTTILPTLGVVQTAYANGASTAYLRAHHVDVTLAKTGVKYVHAAAHDRYDIGVYFEANGHGTVLFGTAYYDLLRTSRPTTTSARTALLRLQALPTLVNQAVGDAISDLLLIDAILQIEDCNVEQWSRLYQDLPSKQTKVSVPDRTMIQINDTETRCVQPEGLQAALDRAIAQHGGGDGLARAFIRPSGTENVVRVYAEATTNPEGLANAAEDIVRQFCCSALSKI